jgi:hypothetical protein
MKREKKNEKEHLFHSVRGRGIEIDIKKRGK